MQINENRLNEFVQQVFGDLSAMAGGAMVALGDKLGLYREMRGAGPITSVELAHRTGCSERYVREWLNSQAAGGYVEYHPESRTYELSPEQAMVLADDTSPVYMPPAWEVAASMWLDEEKAIKAFRSGKGVPWGDHNHRLFCGTAAFFRNGYLENLVSHWLPALDGVVAKLERGATVADVGCGYGHSTVIMAKAFPNSHFFGFDSHADSIREARKVAKAGGVEDRVHFEVAKAKTFPKKAYDLVCFFDCLHDMGDPVGAARHALDALADDGTVMLVEPHAGDAVEENMNPIGRMFYSASTVLCCAHSISEEVGTALGAQAGERQLGKVFRDAGYSRFRRATETPFNLILEARP